MKKFIAIAAVAISLTACNSGTTEPCTNCATDSTKAGATGPIVKTSDDGTPITATTDTTVAVADSLK